MKALVLGLLCLMLSSASFSLEKSPQVNDQDTQLLMELIDGTMQEAFENYSEEELNRTEQLIETMGVKKAYCCRGTNGPSMRCRTGMRFRCSRKPGCYWNC